MKRNQKIELRKKIIELSEKKIVIIFFSKLKYNYIISLIPFLPPVILTYLPSLKFMAIFSLIVLSLSFLNI